MSRISDDSKPAPFQYGMGTLILLPLVVAVFMTTFYRFHIAATELRISNDHIRWAYGLATIVGVATAIPSFRQRKPIRGLVIGIIGAWAVALVYMAWGIGIDPTWLLQGD